MARSLVEKTKLWFLSELDGLKRYTGKDDQGLADLLGCSIRTVCKMRTDPYGVSGKYILLVHGFYEREKKRAKL